MRLCPRSADYCLLPSGRRLPWTMDRTLAVMDAPRTSGMATPPPPTQDAGHRATDARPALGTMSIATKAKTMRYKSMGGSADDKENRSSANDVNQLRTDRSLASRHEPIEFIPLGRRNVKPTSMLPKQALEKKRGRQLEYENTSRPLAGTTVTLPSLRSWAPHAKASSVPPMLCPRPALERITLPGLQTRVNPTLIGGKPWTAPRLGCITNPFGTAVPKVTVAPSRHVPTLKTSPARLRRPTTRTPHHVTKVRAFYHAKVVQDLKARYVKLRAVDETPPTSPRVEKEPIVPMQNLGARIKRKAQLKMQSKRKATEMENVMATPTPKRLRRRTKAGTSVASMLAFNDHLLQSWETQLSAEASPQVRVHDKLIASLELKYKLHETLDFLSQLARLQGETA
ncbi:hypothetical protein SDRG_16058 [Saprolegnia diclina VS20]|uniref:Uncharacterized protein n=1 Tax=Saprolegnia diclina (strain VS20) TaxID=1156394 RepID=T0R263_SAPDV|nr:hypothetical protein SDRG_16058 [Saprolegnia diclina VS20]EQC26108.1 hypothetical protein SDRG_16058 [Saprolegnia diclina VS20]|eukprot:XP_008620475.1 hypothetical protein SDRG_16058 [Saprolegnia diclina VS20]